MEQTMRLEHDMRKSATKGTKFGKTCNKTLRKGGRLDKVQERELVASKLYMIKAMIEAR